MPSRLIRTEGYGAQIKVLGLREVTKALQAAAPDLKRHMDSQIRNAVGTVAGTAAGRINRRSGASAGGYTVKRGGNRITRFGYRISNAEKGAAITEFAGSVTSGKPGTSGPALISSLDAEYGRPGRVLWAAWDELSGWVDEQIDRAVQTAEHEMQARFDTAAAAGV